MREIPALALLAAPVAVLRERAETVRLALGRDGIAGESVETIGSVGAGAFPDAALPGAAVALSGDADAWAARLRAGTPAVVGRVHDGRLYLDLRAVLEHEVPDLARAVVAARG
jgi:L-seryl-tRNA(Ser) seleniumtransferase